MSCSTPDPFGLATRDTDIQAFFRLRLACMLVRPTAHTNKPFSSTRIPMYVYHSVQEGPPSALELMCVAFHTKQALKILETINDTDM